jgi:hypothetical protein
LTEEVEAQAGSRQEVNALQEDFDQLVKDTKVRSLSSSSCFLP